MAGAKALFVQRAGGDAEQRQHRAGDAKGAFGLHRRPAQDHQRRPRQPQDQADPAAPVHRFAHDARRDQGDEDGLQADHDGDATGRDAGLEGDVAKAEIDDLDQEAHHGHVQNAARRGEARPHHQRHRDQQRQRQGVAQRQHGQGRGMGNGNLGDGKARRPQDQEDRRGGKQPEGAGRGHAPLCRGRVGKGRAPKSSKISGRSLQRLRRDFFEEIAYPSIRMRAFDGSKGLSSTTTASHSFSCILTFSLVPTSARSGRT
jgi:hypothetical protein